MIPHRLENYLRAYRKKAGLSQRDVAVLLGGEDNAHISRYEKRHRLPSLETALAYEVILGVPVSELFAGIRESIKKMIEKRRLKLRTSLENRVSSQKTQSLANSKGPSDAN